MTVALVGAVLAEPESDADANLRAFGVTEGGPVSFSQWAATMVLEFIENLTSFPHTFDFVYSSEVIEHVGDIKAYMNLLERITHKGSFIYITTPDIGSRNRPENVLDWTPFGPPQHSFTNINFCVCINSPLFILIRYTPLG